MYRYFLALTVAITSLYAEGQATSDIRKVKWGMTSEEVRNTESLDELDIDMKGMIPEGFEKLSGSVTFLTYLTNVLELDTILVYVFNGDRLVAMMYGFNPSHSSHDLYASDFANVINSLVGKYGRWRSDVDTSTELERRAGLEMGSLLNGTGYRRTVEWQTSRTYIRHQITGDYREVAHVLFYESIENYRTRKRASQSDI